MQCSREIVKDKNNNLIGTLKTEGHMIRLTDRNNNTVGVYNKNSNTTLDKNNSFVGSGNQLLRLLK